VDLYLPTSRETGRPRGFAFIAYAEQAQAADAIRRFDQLELRGRKLNVRQAEDRPQRSPSGPPRTPSRSPFDANPFGGDRRGVPGRRFKTKGSRRGLRGRKRSL